mmetsp:Transcript_26923/g.25785  ORF Transcript_26923/g.25785 Transcript_26923/m.25785 type:complete len:210 (+) Transcript_26923:107-736(+)
MISTMGLFLITLLTISLTLAKEEDFAAARIFLHKSTSSKFPLVIGSDFVVNYVVSNSGEAPATTLVMTDRYDPSSFELLENVNVNGSVSFKIPAIEPGSLASYKVTVRPKIKGMYEATRAKITYNPSAIVMEDVAPDLRSGFSTSLGKIQIISEAEKLRNEQKVTRDWFLLGGVVLVIIYLSYYVLSSLHSKIEDSPVVEEKAPKRKNK